MTKKLFLPLSIACLGLGLNVAHAQYRPFEGGKSYIGQFGNVQQFSFGGNVDDTDTLRPFEARTFIHEQWTEYVVETTIQEEWVRIEEARYNSLYQQLAFQDEEGVKLLNQEYVQSFYIQGEEGEESRYFINPAFYNIAGSENLPMLEVLTMGNLGLVKEYHFQVITGSGKYDPQSGSVDVTPKLAALQYYYLYYQGALHRISNRFRFWRTLTELTAGQFDVKAYARENGLRVSRQQDWPALVAAANAQ